MSGEQEVEGVSIAEYDELVRTSAAWHAISRALDENAADRCSAADVAALGFEMQERLADPRRSTYLSTIEGLL